MKNKAWVIVANSAIARLFQIEKASTLHELKTFVHPESRLHEQDLVSSKPGVSIESVTGSPHPIEPQTTQKQAEFELFAKEIADFLHQEYKEGHFSHLYLAAAPSFLGLLRHVLNQKLQKVIIKEINKNIVHLSNEEIFKQVDESR